MSHAATEVLQDIHTATNDVLKGYREMASRAKPDIEPLIRRLIEMHERHAAEQAAMLAQQRADAVGDTSLQGTVNKAVVIMRDWLSGLDRDTLPAVRQGEESLRDEYDEALRHDEVAGHDAVGLLLKSQIVELDHEIDALPDQ